MSDNPLGMYGKSSGLHAHLRKDAPTIANMPAADLPVTFPSGETRNVNMIVLLVETQNAEFKRDHGMFLPGVAKQHPTIKSLREKYELDYFFDAPVKTWSDCAAVMRHIHTLFTDHIKASQR